jgi:RNA polymerase sigma-70 factor (ECF subfamily)
MEEKNQLAAQFEDKRSQLRAVAYRMLGSRSEADDALQEAWLRVSRADASSVENLGGWLTTIVARVCLDLLRARKARRERTEDAHSAAPVALRAEAPSPEHDALLADSVGLALLVVLETLGPAERLAFVLHDMFDLPFEEIASIVGCSPAAARQLASRARRRVQGSSADLEADADLARQRAMIDAFLVASRQGDLSALLALLAPDAELRPDRAAVAASAAAQGSGALKLSTHVRGADVVADAFAGRARAARAALIDGSVGAVWAPGGQVRVAIRFTLGGDAITAIDVIADPDQILALEIAILDA